MKQEKNLAIGQFFKILSANLKNNRWSWGASREDGVIFLRVWQHDIETHNGSRYVKIAHKNDPIKLGYKERLEHVDSIQKGASCYLIVCEAKDINAKKRQIKAFNKDEIFPGGKVEMRGEDWWIELCPAIPLHQIMLPRLPEEIDAGVYSEGNAEKILVNKYERSSKARKACIKRWGTACVVCDFDFGKIYGKLAEGFIHVHHLKQLSEVGKEYEVDPINDLRPICPNCHAVIHQNGGCRAIEEVKSMLQQNSNTGKTFRVVG